MPASADTRNKSTETLSYWIQCNRIKSSALVDALDCLGATEVIDLTDLSDEDILTFQPPFLKKLEYVRFRRGIATLKSTKEEQANCKIIPKNPPSSVSSSVTTTSHLNSTFGNDYKTPPLPSSCPEIGCNGVLSPQMGTRKNKYLVGLDGPDFRWIITCSKCSRKWHACHFLCGKLQKISSMGASDIIRHEQGRFNRWQKKIKPPCALNPQSSLLKARYAEQKKNTKVEVNNKEQALNGGNADGEEIINSGTTIVSNISSVNPNHPVFDNQLRSMLHSLDEDVLQFSDDDELNELDKEFFAACNSDDDITLSDNANTCASAVQEEEPATKKAKVAVYSDEAHELSEVGVCNKNLDLAISQLADDVNEKCHFRESVRGWCMQ